MIAINCSERTVLKNMSDPNISDAALGGAIAAAVAVLIILIILIVVTAYCIVRKCRQSRERRGESNEAFTYIEHKEPRTLSELKNNRAHTLSVRPARRLEDDAAHMHVYSQVQIPKTRNEHRSNIENREISDISSQIDDRVDIRDLDTGYTSFIEDERELMRWFDSVTGEIFPDSDYNQNSNSLRDQREDQWRRERQEIPTIHDHTQHTRDTRTMDRTGPRLGIRMKRANRHRYNTPHSYVPYDEPTPDPPFYSDTL